METLYIKVGNRYKKIGSTCNIEYMQDGLWLIQSHDSSKEMNNISLRMSELPRPGEVKNFVKSFMNKNTIIEAIKELESTTNFKLYNISLNDLAEKIINYVYLNSI